MANYNVKYRIEYQATVPTQPNQPLPWFRINFLHDGYAGEIIELTAGETPLRIKYADSSDSVFEPLVPLEYQFSLACEEFWQANDFYVKINRQIQILIEIDETGTQNQYKTCRTGWVEPADMKEPYQGKPYLVDVTGTCGLASLKEISLIKPDDTRMMGMVSYSEVIRTALLHTDIGHELVSIINLYEATDVSAGNTVGGAAPAGLDPLYNKMIHADALLTDENEVMSCWDALLKMTEQNLQLKQGPLGRWFLTRVSEVAGDWDPIHNPNQTTALARIYTGNDPASTAMAVESIDFTVVSGKNQPLRAELGQCAYWHQRVEAGVRVEQTFGTRLSDFVNGNMVSVDETGLPTGWGDTNMPPQVRYRIGTGTADDPYRLLIKGAGDELFFGLTPYVYTSVEYGLDSLEWKRFIKRRLRGKFRLTNARAAKIAVMAERDDGPYLRTGGEWVRFDKVKKAQAVGILIYNTHTEIVYANKTYEKQVANVGIADIDIDLGTMDRCRKIIVCYCLPEALDKFDANGKRIGPETGPPTPQCEYWPLHIEAEEEGFALNGMQQTIVAPGKKVKNVTHTLTLGDVPPPAKPINRVGTTYRRSSLPTLTPTTLHYRPNGNPAVVGQGDTQLGWTAKERAKQAMLGPMNFTGSLIGPMPWGPLSVVEIDDLPGLGRAVITDWDWDTKRNSQTVRAQQLLTGMPSPSIPGPKKEFQTPEGLVPLNESEDGVVVEPVEKPYVSGEEKLIKKLKDAGVIFPDQKKLPAQSGFTPILDGSGKLGATVTVGGIIKGKIVGQLRKEFDFTQIKK